MKTFDTVASLDNADTNAFAISNALSKQAADQATGERPELYAPTFKADEFNAQLDNAYRSHIENNLPKPDVDQPELRDTLKAAFQTGNIIGSALSSQTLAETFFPTKDSPELTDDQIMDQVGRAGLMPQLQKFQGVTNQAQFNARLSDIEREQQNQTILQASGLSGTAAMLLAGTVDLPTLIPIGKAVQLGAKGASLLETAGKTAAVALVDTGISEAGLQSTQQLRTPEEAVINIASGAIIGAALGGSIHAILGAETADRVAANLDAYREDAAHGFPKARSAVAALDAETTAANGIKKSTAGAAFADLATKAEAQSNPADAKAASLLLDKIPSITTAPTEVLGRIMGNRTLLGRPRDAFRSSPISSVRQFKRMFYNGSGEVSEANAAGKTDYNGLTFEDHKGADEAELSTFTRTVHDVYAANKNRFSSANDLANASYNAALTEGIDKINGDPAIEAVARAARKYLDFVQDKHVSNNRLPEDTPVMGAPNYVPRLHKQVEYRNRKEAAMDMLRGWAKRTVQKDWNEIDEETGYTSQLDAYNDAKGSYQARYEKRETDYNKALATYNETVRNNAWTAEQSYARDRANWDDRVAEWGANPANDGKPHPYGKSKPFKKDYELGNPPKPLKGPEATILDGYPKPATPKNKYGVKFTADDIDDYAEELANHAYNHLAGNLSENPRLVTSRFSPPTGYLKGRVVSIADDNLAENFFLNTNLLEVLEHVHRTAGVQSAFGNLFKTKRLVTNPATGEVETQLVGDYDGSSVLARIKEEADDAIRNASGPEATSIKDHADKMLAGADNEIKIGLNNFNSGNGLISPKFAHTVNAIAYNVRLGGVTISSLMDPVNIALSNGLAETFAHGILPMLRNYRETVGSNGVMRRQGVRTGNVIEVLHNTRMADTFDLHRHGNYGDWWTDFVNKSTKLATQLTLISHWTDIMKQVAHNVTSSRILGYAEIGWDRLTQKNRAWLASLGLGEEQMAKVAAEYANQGVKQHFGVLCADLDNWSDADLAARFASAFRREGRNVIVTPSLGDVPQFAKTREGKIAYQFSSYMLSSQVKLFARQAQLSGIAGDASEKMRQRVAFGAGLSSLVLGAVFVDAMKRSLRDNEVDWNKFTQRRQDNTGGAMYDAIDRAGFMGSLFNTSNTVGKFSNGQYSIRGGVQWLAGDRDRGDARKVRDIGKFGVLLGPGPGIAEDLLNSAEAVAKVGAGGNLNRSDIRRFQNTLPYHAVPGIQQGLNAIADFSSAAFGVPPDVPRH